MYEKIDDYIMTVEDPQKDLLEILIAAQEMYGRITDDLVSHLSLLCSTDPQEIWDTIEFFPFLLGRKRVIQVCTGFSCSLRGSRYILEDLSAYDLQIEETSCLGVCSRGPNILIDGVLHSEVTYERLEEIKRDILKIR